LDGTECKTACPDGKWAKVSAATVTATTTAVCTENSAGCKKSEPNTDATTEKCTECNEGYGPLASDACPKIVCTDTEGCDTCSDKDTCIKCKTGYTLASGKCTKDSTTSGIKLTVGLSIAAVGAYILA
jgi:hypothetical protein